jgi:hypothetical protein
VTDDVGKVAAIFKSIEKKLHLEYDDLTAAIEHRGGKGNAREEAIGDLLRKVMPANVEVVQHAEIITVAGETSGECDLVICDRGAPQLLDSRTFRILPVESVFGVVEVKSHLDKRELRKAHKAITEIKRFRKDALMPQGGVVVRTLELYGQTFHYFPVVGFVAAYDGIDIRELGDCLDELQRDSPAHERIDGVWVLKQGLLVNASDSGGWDLLPSDTTRLLAVISESPFLWMVVALQALFQSAHTSRYTLNSYLAPHDVMVGEPVAMYSESVARRREEAASDE